MFSPDYASPIVADQGLIVGSRFIMQVMVDGVPPDGFNGFDITINYNNNTIRANSLHLGGAACPAADGCLFDTPNAVTVLSQVDTPPGSSRLVVVVLGTVIFSPGILFRIEFEVTGVGSSPIDLREDVSLIVRGSQTIAYEATDGLFDNTGSGIVLTTSPSLIALAPGDTASANVTVANFSPLNRTVDLSATISPVIADGPVAALDPLSVTVSAGGTASSTLTLSTVPTTPPGVYLVEVNGTSEGVVATTVLSLTVLPPPSFVLMANPTPIVLQPGGANVSSLAVVSVSGFAGQVTLQVETSNPLLTASVNPSTVFVGMGGAAFSTVKVNASFNLPLDVYNVTVTGTSGSLVDSITLQVSVVPGVESLYYVRIVTAHEFVGGGTPQNFHSDDSSLFLPLNFSFPYYGQLFSSIWVSSNGLITFSPPTDRQNLNSIAELGQKIAIAPLWDDLATYYIVGDDIYVTRQPGRLVVRWQAYSFSFGSSVNFEAILSSDGVIQFNYGYGGRVSATVGISNGLDDILALDINDSNLIPSQVFRPIPLEHDLQVSVQGPNIVQLGNSTAITAQVTNTGLKDETNVLLQLTINGTVVDGVTIPLLPANGSSVQLTFHWTPAQPATYLITALAPPVENETRTQNNNATITVEVLDLKGYPDPQGDTYGFYPTQLDIAAINAEFDRKNLVFTFTFYSLISPPSLTLQNSIAGYIDIDSDQNPSTGVRSAQDYFGRPPESGLGDEYIISLFSEIGHPGKVDVYDTIRQSVVGQASITFTSHTLVITVPLSFLGEDGLVNFGTIIGTFREPTDEAPNACCATSQRISEHDLALVSLGALSSSVALGQTLTLVATVANPGTFIETFDATFYANGTLIGTIQNITLEPGQNTTLFFDWDTLSSAPGKFLLTASVTILPEEKNTGDNSIADGMIRILPRRLSIRLTGSFDYLIRENVRARIDALVTDLITGEPVSGANVTIQVYDDGGNLLFSAKMIEVFPDSGVYEWMSAGTLNQLRLGKGVYLVRAAASYQGGPLAHDILLFHIDPPPEQSSDGSSGSSGTGPLWSAASAMAITGLTLVGLFLITRRGLRRPSLAPFHTDTDAHSSVPP